MPTLPGETSTWNIALLGVDMDRQRRDRSRGQCARRRREAPAGDDGQNRHSDDALGQNRSNAAAACCGDRRASAGVRRKRFSAASPSSTATSASLIDRMIPYWLSISAPKLSSWTTASASPVSTSMARTKIAAWENRFRTGSSGCAGRHAITASGASAPTQKATPTPCRNTPRPGQPLRRRRRGMPARGERQADAGQRERRQRCGDARAPGFAAQRCRRSSPPPRSAGTETGWLPRRPSTALPSGGRRAADRANRAPEARAPPPR